MTEKDRHNKTDRGRAIENQQKKESLQNHLSYFSIYLGLYLPLVVAYFMCIADIVSKRIFVCDVVPPILSITVITVLNFTTIQNV